MGHTCPRAASPLLYKYTYQVVPTVGNLNLPTSTSHRPEARQQEVDLGMCVTCKQGLRALASRNRNSAKICRELSHRDHMQRAVYRWKRLDETHRSKRTFDDFTNTTERKGWMMVPTLVYVYIWYMFLVWLGETDSSCHAAPTSRRRGSRSPGCHH